MATRSRIGIEDDDGSIRSVYVHNDGYIAGVGATLHEHYQDRAKVEELLKLGSLSCLGTTTAGRPFDSAYDRTRTVAYHRDRGESLREPTRSADRLAYRLDGNRSGADFLYLLDRNGSWQVRDMYGEADFQPLANAIEADQAA